MCALHWVLYFFIVKENICKGTLFKLSIKNLIDQGKHFNKIFCNLPEMHNFVP